MNPGTGPFSFTGGTGQFINATGQGQMDIIITLDRFPTDTGTAEQTWRGSITLAPLLVAGDFNDDGHLTGDDIDVLAGAVAAGSTDTLYDLSGDGQISFADVEAWLVTKGTLNGDADLNGGVQFADFVIFAGSFGQSGAWTAGDFDASGNVQFPDFAILANNFGQSAQLATAAVPEPAPACLLLFGAMGLWRRLANGKSPGHKQHGRSVGSHSA
jgi:hypothetical protein